MTAATYTFTLSAAQSSATSMVVAMRAKTGSSIPGNASRWQGGVMPQVTLNWAAGAMTATATVNTAPNSSVDGNAEYEWYKVSSTPSDLTLSTASLPTVTIIDDDTSGGGGGNSFGPADTADTTLLNTGTTRQRHSYVNRSATNGHAEMRIGFDAAQQNGVIVRQTTGTTIVLLKMVAGAISSIADVNYQRPGGFLDGDVVRTDVLASGNVILYVNDSAVNGGGWGVSSFIAGNYARILNWEVTGAVIPSVTITTNNL